MSETGEVEIEEAEVEEGGGWSLPTFCIVVLGGVVAFLMYATNETAMWTDANPSKAHSDTRAIYRAAEQYLMTCRRIPTIEELTTPDAKGRAYLESLSDDPWGQPYVIRETDGDRFQVLSFGEDLWEGTQDDVVHPATDSQEG